MKCRYAQSDKCEQVLSLPHRAHVLVALSADSQFAVFVSDVLRHSKLIGRLSPSSVALETYGNGRLKRSPISKRYSIVMRLQ